MRAIEPFADGIVAIDTGYVKPRLAASHLLLRDGRAAFVDVGTTRSTPKLLAALEAHNIPPEYVDYVFITHVHLDHAGGAGAIMQQLPNATLIAHPRAAPHLAMPTRLVEATNAVYGEKTFRRLYGEIIPVPESRIRSVQDGERLFLGESPIDFLHTPGHALHHYCMHDRVANVLFTGDTFGVSYRVFDNGNGAFIFPATTPTHFDPDQLHASIDRLLALNADAAYLTHYSRVENLETLAEDLHGDIVAFVEIAKRCADRPNRVAKMKRMMMAYLCARLDEHGFPDDERRSEWLKMDVDLNAKGLDAWLNRQG